MTKLANVRYGYTDNGNQYKKTSNGSKAGTLAGAVIGGASMLDTKRELAYIADKITESKLSAAFDSFAKFDKMTGKAAMDTVAIGGKKTLLKTVAEKVITSKCGRAALAAGAAASIMLAGKVLGSLIDAGVNKFKEYRTDKAAEQKEAIISEYKASKADEE